MAKLKRVLGRSAAWHRSRIEALERASGEGDASPRQAQIDKRIAAHRDARA